MAALQARCVSGSVACAVGAVKSIMQVVAPTNQRVKLLGFSFTFDGTTSTATPVECKIVRQSTAGTTWGAATNVPVIQEPELTETVQTNYKTNCTAGEPTVSSTLRDFNVPAFMGSYAEFLPLGQEIVIGGGGFLGFQTNAPAAVNVRVEALIEE
jgi:hypothetical protein